MKVLYAYRYGIVGGVSTQLLLRQQALHDVGWVCDVFFSQDNGLKAVLNAAGKPGRIFFGADVRFSALLKRGGYDHVVVIDTPELLAASQPRWWQPKRQLWLDVHTTTTTGLSYLGQVNLAGLAGVMVPTAYSAALVRQRLPTVNPLIMPNVIDGRVFFPSEQTTDAAAVAVNSNDASRLPLREFVWVGKLDSHKNWRLALVYARLLQELFTHIRFTLVGGYTAPAEVGQAFFTLADQLGILPSVRWVDRIDNTLLADAYRRCASSGGAMVVTSRDESFGMAVAEALMCGCPVITNDLPVFREVFPPSPMMQRVDIWQPEQFEPAALALVAGVSRDDVAAMYTHLTSAYGPQAFRQAFEQAVTV